MLSPLRNQEVVLSSRIEGTISTMDEILQYEATHEDIENTNVRSDVLETLLYQRALKNPQSALEDGYELFVSVIKQIHSQLMSFGRGEDKSPGKFKKTQNYLADKSIKQIKFIPISPENLNFYLDLTLKETGFIIYVYRSQNLSDILIHPVSCGMIKETNLIRKTSQSNHFVN